MTAWARQPPAVRATLNPVLVGAVVAWASNAYRGVSGDPLPWPLAFVVPALVLHEPTRRALPGAASKRLLVWQRENEELVAGLPARCLALKPFTSAGLRAALRHGLLQADGAALRSGPVRAAAPGPLVVTQRSAALVGRWFAPLPTATVLAQLGMTT